ncbi:MAG TPA: hypothetical protein VM348_11500, partial [Brevundimonas sp.]|nr:hypothetical protein [Brevundimonas sp.]
LRQNRCAHDPDKKDDQGYERGDERGDHKALGPGAIRPPHGRPGWRPGHRFGILPGQASAS